MAAGKFTCSARTATPFGLLNPEHSAPHWERNLMPKQAKGEVRFSGGISRARISLKGKLRLDAELPTCRGQSGAEERALLLTEQARHLRLAGKVETAGGRRAARLAPPARLSLARGAASQLSARPSPLKLSQRHWRVSPSTAKLSSNSNPDDDGTMAAQMRGSQRRILASTQRTKGRLRSAIVPTARAIPSIRLCPLATGKPQ